MNKILLSILIPTVVGRETSCEYLGRLINKQYKFHTGFCSEIPNGFIGMRGDEVEVIWSKDNKEKTIGEKREELYKKANGIYSVQWDDDDSMTENAIELMLNAIKNNPEVDCITFQERCEMDGGVYKSNHSRNYGGWQGEKDKTLSDGFTFWRTPFYKDIIKTEIAKQVPFRHIRFGEDIAWSMDLLPLLKSEYHIDEEIYIYKYTSTDPVERYGLNK